MLYDPIFILSVIGMSSCVIFWMKDTIKSSEEENFITRNISTVATLFGLMMLYSIFINAGDLGIILFIGSIIAFLVLIVGVVIGNSSIIQTSRGYFIPIFLIFVLRTFIYEPYQIPSGSMLPGLQKGDFLVVNKNSYGLKVNRTGKSFVIKNDPEYGDVVVFIPPHVNVPYIKRLIGKPGDTIGYLNKKIYVNGKAIKQELISTTQEETFLRETLGNSERIIRIVGGSSSYPEEFMVPANHYFVMGDNRDNSSDSRFWGFVPKENFMGTGELIWMSWECWTCLPSFERAGFIQ